jgi:hypothetical protein
MNSRHTEWFGPDIGRGPFAAHQIEVASLQIATALAQLRAPLTRADDDLRAHADFIRELADRLAPDWAVQIALTVAPAAGGVIATNILAATGTCSLLHCWLADGVGGGLTATAPDSVTVRGGAVVQTIEAHRHLLLVTPTSGVLGLDVAYGGIHTWRWAVARFGRVYYSTALEFA